MHIDQTNYNDDDDDMVAYSLMAQSFLENLFCRYFLVLCILLPVFACGRSDKLYWHDWAIKPFGQLLDYGESMNIKEAAALRGFLGKDNKIVICRN